MVEPAKFVLLSSPILFHIASEKLWLHITYDTKDQDGSDRYMPFSLPSAK